MKNVYVVMYAYYSDWEIYGYFDNLEEAEKYCAVHNDKDLHVEIVPSFIGKEDLSNIKLKYEHEVAFDHDDNKNAWIMRDEPTRYTYYKNEYRRNRFSFGNLKKNNWIIIHVNTTSNDRKLAENIAQNLLMQFLYECDNVQSNETINKFNSILAKEETDRIEKEKAEQLKEKELAELKRLKEKYET